MTQTIFSTSTKSVILLQLIISTFLSSHSCSGLMSAISRILCTYPTHSEISVPFFELRATNEDANKFEEVLEDLESEKLYGLSCREKELVDFVGMLKRGSLNLFPEYQRSYVWKAEKASRLIATVLCNRFIPPVVLHEKKKGDYDVVDGKQRLTSLIAFYLNGKKTEILGDSVVREKMAKILPDLKSLSKLDESYEALNGLTFDELSEDRQRAFESYSVNFMIIPYETPKADVFEVYEDINSGGEDLTQQQVRRAVYHGPYIQLIDTLKDTCGDFHAIRNPQTFQSGSYEPCLKESDGELILRAFAFRRNGGQFKPSIKKFLNKELEGTEEIDEISDNDKRRVEELISLKQEEFERVMKVARNVFGEMAFRKKKQGEISKTMWDAKYCAIAELLVSYKEIDFLQSKDAIFDSVMGSLREGYFSKDNERTSAKLFLERRDELKRVIKNAIEQNSTSKDNRRTFPPNMKYILFKRQNGICAYCNQSIDEGRLDETNYVNIDHVVPWSKGGKTEESNAQLLHGPCNNQKKDKV